MIDNLSEGVSRELARHRASQIRDLQYRLSIELKPGALHFKATEQIVFKLSNLNDPIILDFRDADSHIDNIIVNGQSISEPDRREGHIIIPNRYFKSGENSIDLKFEASVATSGRPVIRYNDRDDGSEYIYTLFVPMDASLVFPCFDQPDLKARFKLTLITPEGWTAISNTEVESRRDTAWVFRETKPISTYLFAFAAGPFLEFTAEKSAPRFFVRKSQAKRVAEHLKEISDITHRGMKHFVDFFAFEFPFTKYDQVLIPGFAYGGMEHAGATFLREDSILFRAMPTKSDRYSRASLILHELAHQWFGDLVTMKWFDDLWLKEGFANYTAYHAMASIYDSREMWKRFYQAHKPVAYNIDATKGTTPIYQEIANLKDAKSAYGAIVYQKAPAILRALSFVIGENNFRDGVRLFLKEHAYANAEWSDLIGAFERVSKRDLKAWADAWVKRRGMPQVDVEWSCDSRGLIDELKLKQRDALNEGGIWPIDTQLLLVYDDGNNVRIAVQLDEADKKIVEATGKRCPVYVFANDGDFGYGRFLLDPVSRQEVIARVGGIKDSFQRTMLWGALWDAVRETEMPPVDYIALALKTLPVETDEELTNTILNRLAQSYQRYLSKPQQAAMAPRIEALCSDLMIKSADAGLRITYFRAFRQVATTVEARRKLKDLLNGRVVIPAVEIKQIDRWSIITSLLSQSNEESEALIAAERKIDVNDDGRKQAYIAEAARADEKTKKKYFNDFLNNGEIAEDWIAGSLAPFNSIGQSDLTIQYLKPALEALPRIKRERKIFFVLAWLNAFIGGQRGNSALSVVREFLANNLIDRDLELKILEVMDELERAVRIQEKFNRV